jgi:hypothetical protein
MPEYRPEWGYTKTAEQYAKESRLYEEKKTPTGVEKHYQGRRIIGRDTPINDGVYFGGGSGDAIVVDDQKDQGLAQTYEQLLQLLKVTEQQYRQQGKLKQSEDFTDFVKKYGLGMVWQFTQKVMPYDQRAVDSVYQRAKMRPDTYSKVYLSAYLGGGVCRHQALLEGYLLEHLKKDGHFNGKVSVDRNFVPNQGGHAWVRYESQSGTVFILDPAQEYIGELKDVSDKDQRWFYERPEDRSRVAKFFKKVRNFFSGQSQPSRPRRPGQINTRYVPPETQVIVEPSEVAQREAAPQSAA